jgi:two-component system, LuxR family, response regulator FixJ
MVLNCCVYLVEDDEAVARSLMVLLQMKDFQVDHFASADAFLHRADQLPRGVILLDVCLPGTDGLEALRELRRRACTWPVIMMTGHAEFDVEFEAKRLGATAILEKPFAPELLFQEVEEALGLVAAG